MNVFQKIKTNIRRHFKIPPEHIGYVKFGDHTEPDYRCPAEDCGFGVSDDWICCPYCGQRLGEFKADSQARFVAMGYERMSYERESR